MSFLSRAEHDGQSVDLEPRRPLVDVIEEALRKRTDAFLAGKVVTPWGGPLFEEVGFIVAPTSPILEADGLQTWMESFTFPVLPSEVAEFFCYEDHGMKLGRVVFKERIGTKEISTVTHIEATEPELLAREQWHIGTQRKQEVVPLERLILVRPYPTTELADMMCRFERGELAVNLTRHGSPDFMKQFLPEDVLEAVRQYHNSPHPSGLFGLLK